MKNHIHLTLEIGSLFLPRQIAVPIMLVNSLIYIKEGEYVNAALSALVIAPGLITTIKSIEYVSIGLTKTEKLTKIGDGIVAFNKSDEAFKALFRRWDGILEIGEDVFENIDGIDRFLRNGRLGEKGVELANIGHDIYEDIQEKDKVGLASDSKKLQSKIKELINLIK